MKKFVYSKKEAKSFEKAGIRMWVYSDKTDLMEGGVVYQEVDGVHDVEFMNKKSAFLYYIIEGRGEFVIEGKEYPVKAGEVVMVPPRTRFYYKGKNETGVGDRTDLGQKGREDN